MNLSTEGKANVLGDNVLGQIFAILNLRGLLWPLRERALKSKKAISPA